MTNGADVLLCAWYSGVYDILEFLSSNSLYVLIIFCSFAVWMIRRQAAIYFNSFYTSFIYEASTSGQQQLSWCRSPWACFGVVRIVPPAFFWPRDCTYSRRWAFYRHLRKSGATSTLTYGSVPEKRLRWNFRKSGGICRLAGIIPDSIMDKQKV